MAPGACAVQIPQIATDLARLGKLSQVTNEKPILVGTKQAKQLKDRSSHPGSSLMTAKWHWQIVKK